ncbi:hypothetical protein FB107DRAFT_198651, partial [Schizophyllum commune]
DTREYYLAHVASADAAAFAPDEQFSLEEQRLLRNLFALVLRQALAIRGYSKQDRAEKIVFPEVLVMVSIILCECFPPSTHEHHASVMFAVSREPGGDPNKRPAIGLRRRAEMVVSRLWGAAHLDSTCAEPVDEEPNALADGDAHSDMYGHPQQLLYSRSPDSQGPTDACVAHSSNIHPLMTSALYHCLAVGVSGPLVGLSYEKTSTTIHAYVAWLEEAAGEDNDLPIPRILPPIPFDLTEPLCALRLALLLHRTSSVHDWSLLTADETLPWRADICARHILDDTPLSHTDFSNHEAIAIWAQGVYEATAARNDTSMGARTRSAASNSQPRSTSSGSSGQLTAPKLSNAAVQLSRKSARSDSAGSAAGSVKTAKTTDLPRPRTQRYFIVRKVVFCDALHGLGERFDVPKASIYGIAPVWFNGGQDVIRKSICTEQEHLLSELLQGYARYSACFIGYMTPAVQPIIERSLHGVFQVIQAVRLIRHANTNEDKPEDDTPALVHNEATYRFHWDQLIQTIVEQGQIKGVGYRKEAKLRYSEFTAPQTYTSRDATRSDVIDLYSTLFPLAEQGDEGYWLYKWHAEITADESAMAPAAAQEEPRSGTADGILYLTIADVFPTDDVADAVSLWTPSVTSDSSKDDDDAADTWSTEPSGEQALHRSHVGSAFSIRPRCPVDASARAAYSDSMKVQDLVDPPLAIVAPTPPSVPSQDDGSNPPRDDVAKDVQAAEQARLVRKVLHMLALYLPLLVCEFKRLLKGWTEEAATDQERLGLMAVCIYMRLLNVSRFPVFGLVTSGSIGVLSSAWNDVTTTDTKKPGAQATTHNVICIADRQATKVDLRNPLDALNVATFVAYVMTEHASRLRALFESLDTADPSYLLDKNLTPLAKARSLTVKDGHWRKPQSDKQADAREASKLEAVAEQPEPESDG